MAQTYNSAVMTNSGLALLTKAQRGECTLQITRIATGNGTYDDKSSYALKQRTVLKNQKQTFSIASIVTISDVILKLRTRFTNESLAEGYYINEVGVYAQEEGDDTTETLYSLAVCSGETGDYMPPQSTDVTTMYENFFITVDDSDSVVVEIDPDTLLEDTQGLLGTASAMVAEQDLIDVIANKVKNELIATLELSTNDTITMKNCAGATLNSLTIEKATTDLAGLVKPDGTTILIDEDGIISGAQQLAEPIISGIVTSTLQTEDGEILETSDDQELETSRNLSYNSVIEEIASLKNTVAALETLVSMA